MAEPAAAPGGSRRRIAACAALGLAACALVAVAVPRAMSGAYLGPHDETLRELSRGEAVPDRRVAAAVDSRRRALAWTDDAGAWSDLAALCLVQARRAATGGPEQLRLAAAGRDAQARALRRGPADAYGWLRLAQARLMLAPRAADIGPVLALTLDLAPAVRGLLIPRLDLALARWRALAPPLRGRMAAQVRLAARWAPTALARIARKRFAQAAVLDALAGRPELLRRFAYAYSRT